MAAMGAGKLGSSRGREHHGSVPDSSFVFPVVGVHTTFGHVGIVTIANWGIQIPALGLPIMREGFVTETGFLASPMDAEATR